MIAAENILHYREPDPSGHRGEVALTWPRSSLSYTVQVASNVLPLVWTDTTNVVSIVDDKNFTIVPSEYGGTLYRLHGE